VAPEGHAAGDDRDLVEGSTSGIRAPTRAWPASWIGGDAAVLLEHAAGALLAAPAHAVARLLEVAHLDFVAAAHRGEDRGLVDERRELGTAEARRCAGEHLP
jgi:hypothetical protein